MSDLVRTRHPFEDRHEPWDVDWMGRLFGVRHGEPRKQREVGDLPAKKRHGEMVVLQLAEDFEVE